MRERIPYIIFSVGVLMLLIAIFAPPASAIDDKTTYSVIVSENKISSQFTTKSISSIFKTETEKSFSLNVFPIYLSEHTKIDKYKCDEVKCGYWLSTDKKIYINNPIYLIHGGYPYYSIVSEIEDTKSNKVTLTVKEDIKGATYRLLNDFVERL
jgi:hypothetical protein